MDPNAGGVLMTKVAVVGLGKMGISHLSIIGAHPDVTVVGVCDTSEYLLSVLNKYTGILNFADYEKMLDSARPDAVIIATPSRHHGAMVRSALNQNVHVFCEKPLTLDPAESQELAELAMSRNLVNQVGYHYRSVGTFREVKRLLDQGALGTVSHVLAEAYGPVVLRAKGMTWRSQRNEGGGCLFDYAAHPINLVNWFFGEVKMARGSVLGKIFSRDIDDEVYSTLEFRDSPITAQLSVNWSDESFRKMSTKITIFGSRGRLSADRQELNLYLRASANNYEGYRVGWNVRNTAELTDPTWFYLRGEEYSAQFDHFIRAINGEADRAFNDFASGAVTDRTIQQIIADAERSGAVQPAAATPRVQKRRFSFFGR